MGAGDLVLFGFTLWANGFVCAIGFVMWYDMRTERRARHVQIAPGLATELEEERRAREDSDERIRLYIEEAVAADKRATIAESALAKCSDWTKMSVSELAEGNPSLKAYSDNLEYENAKLRARK